VHQNYRERTAKNQSKHTEIYVKTRKGKTTREEILLNLKELQVEICDSVITSVLGFL